MNLYPEQRNHSFLTQATVEKKTDNNYFPSLTALSDAELLLLLFGQKNKNIKSIIAHLVKQIQREGFISRPASLLAIEGVSQEMAFQLAAAFELGRRKIQPPQRMVEDAEAVFRIVHNYAHLPQEHFITLSLNGANEVLELRVITVGLVNRTQVHPREVFADVLTDRASAVILAHNHPSGQLKPSPEDIAVTRRLAKAGALLGIQVLDHVIFSVRGYYSFAEQGTMPSLV